MEEIIKYRCKKRFRKKDCVNKKRTIKKGKIVETSEYRKNFIIGIATDGIKTGFEVTDEEIEKYFEVEE